MVGVTPPLSERSETFHWAFLQIEFNTAAAVRILARGLPGRSARKLERTQDQEEHVAKTKVLRPGRPRAELTSLLFEVFTPHPVRDFTHLKWQKDFLRSIRRVSSAIQLV